MGPSSPPPAAVSSFFASSGGGFFLLPSSARPPTHYRTRAVIARRAQPHECPIAGVREVQLPTQLQERKAYRFVLGDLSRCGDTDEESEHDQFHHGSWISERDSKRWVWWRLDGVGGAFGMGALKDVNGERRMTRREVRVNEKTGCSCKLRSRTLSFNRLCVEFMHTKAAKPVYESVPGRKVS